MTLRREVRKPSTGGIVEPFELRAKARDVGRYNPILVRGTFEVIGETTTTCKLIIRVVGGHFRIDARGPAYGRDVGAAGRKGWQEGGRVFAVIRDAGPFRSNATVSA